MRGLKVWLTTLLITGMVLLLSFPWILRAMPRNGPRREKAQFAILFTTYSITLLLIFFAIVLLAWLIVRKQREVYRQESMENLRTLIEGTLQDHEKPKDS